MSWHDITISAAPPPGRCGKKSNEEPKPILNGVSGCANPGEFVSIIGASGAGKTTLLNHLSGRLASANLIFGGVVKLNGQDVKTLE